MFIVAENGCDIYNADNANRISIYKFIENGKYVYAVCVDYFVDIENYHTVMEKTENRAIAVGVLARIVDAIENDEKILDLSEHHPNCTVVNAADKNIKKGKWETICHGELLVCSRCGHEPPNQKMSEHCPNCGAKMY